MPSFGTSVLTAQPGGRIVYVAPIVSGGLLAGAGVHDISGVQRLVGSSIANGATLQPATGTTFVGVANAGTVVNAAGRTLTWNQGSNTVGTLTVGGTTQVAGFASGGVLQVQPGGLLQVTSNDLLLGGGSRTTLGSAGTPGGTLRVPGDARVQLNGGLLVNNGTLDGALVVNFGGLAKGAGSFGPVTVNDGGRFSPGNSPGTAATGAAVWGAGGDYLVELAAASGTAGVHWDLWAVEGRLDITAGPTGNSRFTITVVTLGSDGTAGPLAGFDATRPWSWRIVDTAQGITGWSLDRLTLDTRGFGSALMGGSLSLAQADGEVFLQFAPVPEPGTWVLMLGGVAALRLWRRSRSPA
jgi:hypothetical protein